MQNAHYEGNTENVEVVILYLFNFPGGIVHAAFNFPVYLRECKFASRSRLLNLN